MSETIAFQRIPVSPEVAEEFGEEIAIAFVGTPKFWAGLLALMFEELRRNPRDDLVEFVLREMERDLGIPRRPMELSDADRR